jgi:flap endonuclease-1
LINAMREANVKPIAIFDEPGVRGWKAMEHEKRRALRALHLSRSLLEDSRQERLQKAASLLETSRLLLKRDQLPTGFQVDVENELLKLDDLPAKSIPTPDEPGSKALREALLLLRDCRQTSRPGEKHASRSAVQFLRDRFQKEDSDAAEAEANQQVEIATVSGPELGSLASTDLVDSLQRVEIAQPAKLTVTATSDSAALGEEVQEEDLEEIATVAVEPSTDFTETPRQTTLTIQENYLLSDFITTITSDSPSQASLYDFQQELRKLQDKAKEVARTYERSHSKPSSQDMAEAQELLEVMGVPIIQAAAPYEAEGVCSAMVLGGIADFAGTEDSDVLVYGASLLKHVATSSKPLELIDGEELRRALELTPEQYRDFLILNGTDACERIHGIGFKRALKLIKEYKAIEIVLEKAQIKKVLLRALVEEGYLDRVEAARKVFSELPPLPPEHLLAAKPVDPRVVEDFMCDRHGIETISETRPIESETSDTVSAEVSGTDIGHGEEAAPPVFDELPDWVIEKDLPGSPPH